MIEITIKTIKADSSQVMQDSGFKVGEKAYYVIRESGVAISGYFHTENGALESAWYLVKKYGFTLVEPW